MKKADAAQIGRLIATECLSVRVRRLSRVITRIYDAALAPHGVGIAQVNLLSAIAAGAARAVDLARILDLEKSTVSRDLKRMQEIGWVRSQTGPAGRVLTLTRAGSRLLVNVREAWESAQAAAEKELGETTYAQLRSALPSPLQGRRR